MAATPEPGAEGTRMRWPPDAQATLPDPQGQPMVAVPLAPVQLGRGDDVVEPAADDAGDHGIHGDVEDGTGRTAARAETTIGQPDMATAMPAKMHRAYARRYPKTCQTPTVGLGMLASSASPIAVSSDMRHFVAAATATLTWSGSRRSCCR